MNEVKVILSSVKTRIPKLLDYEIIPEPMWADDTGRETRKGKFSGTFMGYFTNINMTIGPTTQAEYTILCNLFQRPFMEVEYPLETDGSLKTEEFYGVALKAKKDKYTNKYQPFQIQLTAVERR